MNAYDINVFRDNRIILISHWDTDGICSIAKFKININRDADYYIPPIGIYSIPENEFTELKGYDLIVTLDIALQDSHIGILKKSLGKPVYVIDHHHHSMRRNAIYIDPKMENGRSFYSNTLLMDHVFKLRHDFLTLLGVVGDIGLKTSGLEIYGELSPLLQKHTLNLEDVYKMTLLIDSSHIVNDRSAVKEAVNKILNYVEDPRMILEDRDFNKHYKLVERELDKYIKKSPLEENDVFNILKIDSRYYIISRIGRILSDKYPNKITIIINTGFFKEYNQIYIRSNNYNIDIHEIIDYTVSKGYVSGGKNMVMGIILPKEDTDSFLNYLFEEVKSNKNLKFT